MRASSFEEMHGCLGGQLVKSNMSQCFKKYEEKSQCKFNAKFGVKFSPQPVYSGRRQ
jgi:hypothetical protein